MSGAEAVPVLPWDLDWEERAEQAYMNALPEVRSAAEKWAGLTGVILGAFGFAGFIDGGNEIRSLTSDWEVLTGGSALIALFTGLGGIVAAGLAAQGTPKQILESGEDLRLRTIENARKARSRLRASRVATAIAVMLLLLALGMLWFAPTDSENNRPNFVIPVTPGGDVCGELKSLTASEIVLDVGDGAEVKISPPGPARRVKGCD